MGQSVKKDEIERSDSLPVIPASSTSKALIALSKVDMTPIEPELDQMKVKRMSNFNLNKSTQQGWISKQL